jgi:hypothetical protein
MQSEPLLGMSVFGPLRQKWSWKVTFAIQRNADAAQQLQ